MKGEDAGAYTHPFFRRARKDLVKEIQRTHQGQKDSQLDEDFESHMHAKRTFPIDQKTVMSKLTSRLGFLPLHEQKTVSATHTVQTGAYPSEGEKRRRESSDSERSSVMYPKVGDWAPDQSVSVIELPSPSYSLASSEEGDSFPTLRRRHSFELAWRSSDSLARSLTEYIRDPFLSSQSGDEDSDPCDADYLRSMCVTDVAASYHT
jgi:hypothetical protein